jgi:hypothetical protein
MCFFFSFFFYFTTASWRSSYLSLVEAKWSRANIKDKTFNAIDPKKNKNILNKKIENNTWNPLNNACLIRRTWLRQKGFWYNSYTNVTFSFPFLGYIIPTEVPPKRIIFSTITTAVCGASHRLGFQLISRQTGEK